MQDALDFNNSDFSSNPDHRDRFPYFGKDILPDIAADSDTIPIGIPSWSSPLYARYFNKLDTNDPVDTERQTTLAVFGGNLHSAAKVPAKFNNTDELFKALVKRGMYMLATNRMSDSVFITYSKYVEDLRSRSSTYSLSELTAYDTAFTKLRHSLRDGKWGAAETNLIRKYLTDPLDKRKASYLDDTPKSNKRARDNTKAPEAKASGQSEPITSLLKRPAFRKDKLDGKVVCVAWNKGTCSNPACPRSHHCGYCGSKHPVKGCEEWKKSSDAKKPL